MWGRVSTYAMEVGPQRQKRRRLTGPPRAAARAALEFFEASPDPVIVRGCAARKPLAMNRRARRIAAAYRDELLDACEQLDAAPVLTIDDDGAEYVYELNTTSTVFEGEPAYIHVFRDVTATRRAETALRESERRYALAAYGANDGLWEWDLAANRMYLSPRWKAMLGYSETEVGDSPNEWFIRIHHDDFARVQQRIESHISEAAPNFELEYRMMHKDGSYRWVLTRGATERGPCGEVVVMAGSQSDISERRAAQEQLVRKAFYDHLTDLPNRSLFMDRLHSAVERARRYHDYAFAVLFIDLDRFKVVNDSLGHLVGDRLLVQIARRLERVLRGTDTFARLGGDEFAIILDSIHSPNDARYVAGRIRQELAMPFTIDEYTIHSSASIGIALSERGISSPEDLLREADTAMYRAKAMGTARYQIYDAAAHSNALDLLHLENDLRAAIERDEFVLHYQPIVSIETGAITGLEALIRWDHPTRGLVPPGSFIPLAEDTGLIVGIGNWALAEACRQLAEWERRDPRLAHLSMSVNISTRQFSQPDLVESVRQALDSASLSPDRLKLEITESALIEDPSSAARLLRNLRDMGVKLLIDDFGTGYSSLSYLHQFPLDGLKIDRSFVVRIGEEDGKELEIVKSTISLAHNLSLSVIAEGVETADQAQVLCWLGCEHAQGWFYSRALDAATIEAVLTETLAVA